MHGWRPDPPDGYNQSVGAIPNKPWMKAAVPCSSLGTKWEFLSVVLIGLHSVATRITILVGWRYPSLGGVPEERPPVTCKSVASGVQLRGMPSIDPS